MRSGQDREAQVQMLKQPSEQQPELDSRERWLLFQAVNAMDLYGGLNSKLLVRRERERIRFVKLDEYQDPPIMGDTVLELTDEDDVDSYPEIRRYFTDVDHQTLINMGDGLAQGAEVLTPYTNGWQVYGQVVDETILLRLSEIRNSRKDYSTCLAIAAQEISPITAAKKIAVSPRTFSAALDRLRALQYIADSVRKDNASNKVRVYITDAGMATLSLAAALSTTKGSEIKKVRASVSNLRVEQEDLFVEIVDLFKAKRDGGFRLYETTFTMFLMSQDNNTQLRNVDEKEHGDLKALLSCFSHSDTNLYTLTGEGERLYNRLKHGQQEPATGSMAEVVGAPALPPQDWTFVKDKKLRDILERDYAELQKVVRAEAPKSILLLSGAILEAALVDVLQSKRRTVKFRNLYFSSPANTRTPPPLLNWDLTILIKVASGLGILDYNATIDVRAVQEFRNLVHPTREHRLKANIDQGTANIMIELLKRSLNQLSSQQQKGTSQAI